jgi:hypothetical protein
MTMRNRSACLPVDELEPQAASRAGPARTPALRSPPVRIASRLLKGRSNSPVKKVVDSGPLSPDGFLVLNASLLPFPATAGGADVCRPTIACCPLPGRPPLATTAWLWPLLHCGEQRRRRRATPSEDAVRERAPVANSLGVVWPYIRRMSRWFDRTNRALAGLDAAAAERPPSGR